MAHRRSHVITNCLGGSRNCSSYGAGHNTHTVQATMAGAAPRAWQHAVVDRIDDLCLTLSLVEEGCQVVVWHHHRLDLVLGPGSAVRLHREQDLLEVESHWISVAVSEQVEAEDDDRSDRVATCTGS